MERPAAPYAALDITKAHDTDHAYWHGVHILIPYWQRRWTCWNSHSIWHSTLFITETLEGFNEKRRRWHIGNKKKS